MRAAKSLKPEVPRPVSSPSSPDDLWPETSSALKSSFPGGLRGKALGPPLPSCQPRSWLEWLGLNQAARVRRHRHCSPPEVPGDSRYPQGSTQTLLVILEADQLSPNSPPPACFLFFFHEREVAVISLTLAGTPTPGSLACPTDWGTREPEGIPQGGDRNMVDVCPFAE